jgi:hypothetical protein
MQSLPRQPKNLDETVDTGASDVPFMCQFPLPINKTSETKTSDAG